MGTFTQGGQLIEQCTELLTLARVLLPAQQQRFGIEQNIHALREEAGNQLRITFDPPTLAWRLLQGQQPCFDHLVNFFDQRPGAVDRRQRRAGQLLQATAQQRLGAFQQVDFLKVEGQLMRLELPCEQVQRGSQLGNRGYAGHGGAAFEGMKGALQIVTDRLRQIVISGFQKTLEAGQMTLRLTTENLQ
ncbi:hypothetical protein D3C77_298410 [compost metagenome]